VFFAVAQLVVSNMCVCLCVCVCVCVCMCVVHYRSTAYCKESCSAREKEARRMWRHVRRKWGVGMESGEREGERGERGGGHEGGRKEGWGGARLVSREASEKRAHPHCRPPAPSRLPHTTYTYTCTHARTYTHARAHTHTHIDRETD
jgi:hypothetical protein